MTRPMLMLVLVTGLIVVTHRVDAQEGAAPAKAAAKSALPGDRRDWNAVGKEGAVAAGGQSAVAAGLSILKAGGNAADAGAATIFALSVTDSRSFCSSAAKFPFSSMTPGIAR